MRASDCLFCLVSFEGPDDYAHVGGLAPRVAALAGELAGRGHDTHLVYFGDPRLPGVQRVNPHLTLHRWAQWLSAECPGGVYQAEDARRHELAASLPPYLLDQMVRPALFAGCTPMFLATEWQTLDFLRALDRLLRAEGLRDKVVLGWDLAAPSVGRFEWSTVPEGVRLLGQDRAVVQAGADAGRTMLPGNGGADALLAALQVERAQLAAGPVTRRSGSVTFATRRPVAALRGRA